jgi:uncharacterized protein YerC
MHQTFAPAQRLEYVKLIVEGNYTIQQVMASSNARPATVSRSKTNFLKRNEVKSGFFPDFYEQRGCSGAQNP